jgi:glycosyltransferase involved in cell wall biosynthesis
MDRAVCALTSQTMQSRRLIAFLNAYTEGISGGDACFIEIARRLQGFQLVVVTSALGETLCRTRGLQAIFWITTREDKFTRTILTYIIRTIKGLLLIRRIQHGDLVYATSDFLPDVLPAFWYKICRKRVWWIQKVFHVIPRQRPIPHYAQKVSHLLIKKAADLVIVDNTLLRTELLQRGFSAERVRVNYPGIDLEQFRVAEGAGQPLYDAVFLGRLHPSKGIFDLVSIWQQVQRMRPSARLALVGRGDQRTAEKLQEQIVAANLTENICLLGFLETPAAIDVLRRSRVFVFPSREEGFGIAILEALASGLPVVAWDLPVYREVFPQGVIRVPVGSYHAFAGEIVRLLENDVACRNLVAEGQQVIQRYDWRAIALQEAKLLNWITDTAASA